MRITGSHRQEGFWADTWRWLRSQRGRGQFLLGALLGAVLTTVLGLGYLSGIWAKIEVPLRAWMHQVRETTQDEIVQNDLPTFFFDIGFEEYQTLAAKREQALQTGVLNLSDEDWLPAEIRYRGDTYPVRIRLKGDWLDHLGERKWSFRVRVRNDERIMGMRTFSVQSPATREFLNEWLFQAELRRADILSPRYSFVNVFVNGENWGVYALEEAFSKELFEAMGRREGLVARYDETLMWQRFSSSTLEQRQDQWDPASALELFTFAEVDEFETNRIQSDPALREQSAAALGLLRGFQRGELAPSEAFDAETMGRYLAYASLWGVGHGLRWHNARYYYNPLTAHLEPIGYDAMPFFSEGFASELAQYEDLEIMRAYAREMQRICRPEYLQEIKELYAHDFARYHSALAQEFAPQELEPPWQLLAEHGQMLASVFLNRLPTVYAYQLYQFRPVGQAAGQSASAEGEADAPVDLQIGNILRYPVALDSLRFGENVPDQIDGEGILSAKRHDHEWVVTVSNFEDGTPNALKERLAADNVEVVDLGLEEVFVELVGRRANQEEADTD